MTPALPYNAVNRRQPQSCPFARLFGGKERLKDSGLGLFIDASAVVTHRQHYIVSGLHLNMATGVFLIQFRHGGFNHHFAALRLGAARFNNRLMRICWICAGSTSTGGKFGSSIGTSSMVSG